MSSVVQGELESCSVALSDNTDIIVATGK
jgi:hypothetical protein